jgi:hypothetical protein
MTARIQFSEESYPLGGFLATMAPEIDGTSFAHDAGHDEATLESIIHIAGDRHGCRCPTHIRLRHEVGLEE